MLAYSGCSRHDCTLRNANGYCSVTACRNPANSNGLTTYTTSYHEPQPSTNADKLREIIRKRISYHCDEREHDFRLGKDCVEPLINDIIRDIWLNQNEPEGGGGVMLKC